MITNWSKNQSLTNKNTHDTLIKKRDNHVSFFILMERRRENVSN